MIKLNGNIDEKYYTVDDLKIMLNQNKKNVTIHGLIYNIRDMGNFAFIVLRSLGGIVQCVYNKNESNKEKELLKCENSVIINGILNREDRAVNGFEVIIEKIEVISFSNVEIPVNIGKRMLNISLEKELEIRPLILRNERKRNIFKLQEGIIRGFRQYLENNNFTEIFTPKIVAKGAEGGANIFKLDYFEKKAYLAQSPQFYKQMLIPVYERVFEIAPVFRAEKHETVRHLNEYISVDFEMGFIDNFYDIINMEIGMLKFTCNFLKENYISVLSKLNLELPEIKEIPCIKFKDAKEIISKKYNIKIKDPYDLEPEEERLISKLFKEEYDSDFVFVTHYPVKKRPFYALDDTENDKYTLSFDLLFKGIEITTGGQRINDYKMQIDKMQSKGLDPDEFENYLMLHKYGCPPHGGLGMGLERFLMKLLDEKNIRMVSMFPRDISRLTP